MFVEGLKHGAYVIVVTIISAAISLLLEDKAITELMVGVTIIIAWIVIGYHFKKKYGSLFLLAIDTEKIKILWHYFLGVGLIWGPAKLFSSGYPSPELSPIINIALIVLSVPLSGISIGGALIIGGLFCRVKT